MHLLKPRKPIFTHDSIVYFAGGVPIALLLARSAAEIIFSLTAIIFLIYCARHRDWGWTKNPTYRLLLTLWVVLIISSALSVHPDKSLKFVLMGLRFPLFFIAMQHWILRSEKDVRYFGWFIACTMLVMAADTGTQWWRGTSLIYEVASVDGRLRGSMHVLDAGIYIAKLWFPALGIMLFMALHSARPRLFTGLTLLASLPLLFLVMLSGERSATMMFLLAIASAGAFTAWHWKAGRKIVIPLMLLSAVGFAVVVSTSPFIHARALLVVEHLKTFWHTPYGQLWQAAVILWHQHPLIGIGNGEFRQMCPSIMPPITYCDIHPHNQYLEWLCEAGIVGFGLYLAFVWKLVKPVVTARPQNTASVVLLACMLGAFVMNLFPIAVTQSFFGNWSGILYWVSISSAVSLLRLNELK